jgi:hypothetical protein
VHWSGPIRGGSKRIEWNMTKDEFALYKDGLKRAGRIFLPQVQSGFIYPPINAIQASSVKN